MVERLTGAGHTVETAWDGTAVLEAARTAPYDLVILDAHIGGMGGYRTLRALKRLETPWPAPPVVILTPVDLTAAERSQWVEVGAGACLWKDAPPRELHGVVARVLRGDSDGGVRQAA